jgi:uncharacterized protein (DUF2141 family)
MRSPSFLIALIISVAIFSCAKQTAPTGGPRDTIPPAMVSSNPPKGALNVKTKTIEVELSEFIALASAKDQIIITPDVDKKYEISARKKKVTLTLEQELQPNTTYTINFRDAIQDLTEKNPAVNLKLAFSTGSYIDSLQITGTVKDLLQNKEVKDATVALYESDTFNIFQHKPVYITKTNAKGEYQFENLKNGVFYIYAFEDRNRNLVVDSRNENYGFLRSPINLDRNQSRIQLYTLRLDSRPIKLTSARPFNTYYNIRTSKGLKTYTLKAANNDSLLSTFGEDRANIRVYNTFVNPDSIAVSFTGVDSIENRVDTTLYVKFLERKSTPEPFTFNIENSRTIARTGNVQLNARSNKPIAYINFDSLFIAVDSATHIPVTENDIRFQPKTGQITISKTVGPQYFKTPDQPAQPQPAAPSKPRSQPFIYLGKSAFISVELDTTQQTQEALKPLQYEDTGIIIAEIQTAEPNYIIQLTNKASEIIASFTNRPKVSFTDLPPGEYLLRLVIDRNGDGEWSPGNFYQRQEPEPIIFYSNEKQLSAINLKANFELGPLLIKY